MRHLSRRAFTLVELLVVIAIIGVLVSLLLPAIAAMREAANRSHCAHNMKQLTLALQIYAEKHDGLPPSSMWEQAQDIEVPNSPKLKANWVVQILPFLDEQPLADDFDHSPGTYISDDITPAGARFNRRARGVQIGVMLCPSDAAYNRQPYNGSAFGQGDGWARGNYAANGGGGFLSTTGGSQCSTVTVDGVASGCAALPDSPGWQSVLRGVMGAALQPQRGGLSHEGGSFAKIKDSKSNTICIGEVRAGVTEIDPRGVWAMSGGPSSLWASTSVTGGDNGPNANQIGEGDTIPQCQQLITLLGATELQQLGMPCNAKSANSPHWQQTVRSAHPGGANIGMCDGSVRYLADEVERGSTPLPVLNTNRNNLKTYNLDQLSVWDRLILSDDRQPVSSE